MARKFLYLVAGAIILVIAILFALRIWTKELTAIAFVPTSEFIAQPALPDNAYSDAALWYVRPGMAGENPARWQPTWQDDGAEGAMAADRQLAPIGSGNFAVFFVHPTSYVDRASWNAPIGDPEVERITQIYLRGMASPFNQAQQIWAPRYRQATIGTFLTDAPEAEMAIDLAYRDVAQAFRHFIASLDQDMPIVLAGHSQGSLHLLRLLDEEFRDAAIKHRLIGAYLIGWPISIEHDLPALAVPACNSPGQIGCIVSWSSYAEPADPSLMVDAYAQSRGLNGNLRGDSAILCVNPLSGVAGGAAEMAENLGTLVPDDDLAGGQLLAGAVPARCNDQGLLLIGDPPKMGRYVLPGNNYHVYDIPLFWANLHRDVDRRARAWAAQG